jgi:hypothetical protein
MWEEITNEGDGFQWILDAITGGTALWVTDGSYNKDVAPTVSGAGWMLYCTATGKRMYGSFYEASGSDGSYRGEILGLAAIHILVAAIEQFYSLTPGTARICCDNRGALFKSKVYRRRIPTGASQADIKRVLRNVKTTLHTTFQYEWVASHQDRYKFWHQLSLTAQLNCLCDTLAKQAVARSLNPRVPRRSQQPLPCESVAVFCSRAETNNRRCQGCQILPQPS